MTLDLDSFVSPTSVVVIFIYQYKTRKLSRIQNFPFAMQFDPNKKCPCGPIFCVSLLKTVMIAAVVVCLGSHRKLRGSRGDTKYGAGTNTLPS